VVVAVGRLSRPPVLVHVAGADDVAGIVAVAALVDELEGGCGDLRYLTHVRRTGHVVVAVVDQQIVGYAGTRVIGPVEMVCDLFVHPDFHGRGVGATLLDAAWTRRDGARMTFSSQHPNALPLYLRAGMAPRWPLLWLRGGADAVERPAGWRVDAVAAELAADLEREWLGVDRRADYEYWTHPTHDHAVAVHDPRGDLVAVGAVATEVPKSRIHHLIAHDRLDAPGAAAAVLTTVSSLTGPCFAALPGPHPAVVPLLDAGWRITDADHWMSSDPTLLDPLRQVLSPGLA
jgi:GNAT superfamily N-acetyltransferase